VVWCAFFALTTAAAWYLYVSKKAGWYLSLTVALSWFAGLIAGLITMSWNLFTIVMTVGMVAVLIWLFLPSVTAHFGVKI
jgi:ribose/xylose/arabinose/galactoside ABC-type transport system permease subunit